MEILVQMLISQLNGANMHTRGSEGSMARKDRVTRLLDFLKVSQATKQHRQEVETRCAVRTLGSRQPW